MDHAQRLERTALIVDDDVFMVSALAELLEEDGFDVHTAPHGFWRLLGDACSVRNAPQARCLHLRNASMEAGMWYVRTLIDRAQVAYILWRLHRHRIQRLS